jgi:3-oxoacyl-[acyl-carrier-protein] synthase III
MNRRSLTGVTFRAVAGALPDRFVTQDDFAALYGEREVERIVRNTGVRSVRTAQALATSDLVYAACRSLLDRCALSGAEIDGLVVVTQTPDAWSPGIGFTLQHRLGLPATSIVLDLNAGCGGYVNALLQSSALITSGACRNVLLCTGDVTTKLLDDGDRHVKMLFGDGASATLLERGEGRLDFICGADGSGRNALRTGIDYARREGDAVAASVGNLHMDGTAVMNFALAKVPATINALLAETGTPLASLDLLVLHQANAFMLNYLRRIVGIDAARVPIDLDGIGNTSSTSIPLVLSRHPAIGTADAARVVLCGFGVGLSWGAVLADLSHTLAIPPVVVAQHERHHAGAAADALAEVEPAAG